MKYMAFSLFFLTFFSIWIGANYYVYHRALQALPSVTWLRILFTILFLFLATSYILVRFVERQIPDSPILHFLAWPGSFWFAGLLYAFLLVFLLDMLRLADHFFHFFPDVITANPAVAKRTAFFVISGLVLIILSAGFINARHPVIRNLKLRVNKFAPVPQLKVALITDMHFGLLVGKSRLEKLVQLISREKPDLIIFGGDLIDEIQQPVIRGDIGAPLRSLSAPLGIYAITGNHEYIGGVERATAYIESLGIKMLRDTAVEPVKFLILAGREDRDIRRFNGNRRKPLVSILNGADSGKTIILADHQPIGLEDAAASGVDLQVSGHTHHGQIWPFSLIVKPMYEIAYGYGRKGNTHYYISNGFGTWGPPVRIGNRPEIAIITLSFASKN